ncbi:hypothetical protein vseg_010675 [Gypsophila vaccaria]
MTDPHLLPSEEAMRRKGFEDAIVAIAQHQQQNSGGNQNSFEKFSKHHPPTYSGSSNSTELTEWLEEMEKLHDLSRTPVRDRVIIAMYFSKELRWRKEEEFMMFRMGDLSLQEYTEKFQELSKLGLNVAYNDEMLTQRYIRNMTPKLRSVMSGGAL